MKSLDEIFDIVNELSNELFDEMSIAIEQYFDFGYVAPLNRVSKKIGLTVDEIWEWENN